MTERRRKRALITRPQEDSADAAIALAKWGITPVLAPMMQIEYAAPEIENEVSLAQAILFTSRNGVRAFARLVPRRDIPVLAVGDSTAALARDMGFVNVQSAQGDSADLGRLTIDRLNPADGILFHAAGATVAGDLTDALNKAGFRTMRRTVYEAKPVETLADDTATALRDRTLDYVLFFSPRTGRIFADLVQKAGLAKTCDSLTAICLSDAVASEITDIEWRDVLVARQPTTTALLSVIAELDDNALRPPARTLPPEDTNAAAGSAKTAADAPADEGRGTVEQIAVEDEDARKPEEDAMTDTDPSRPTSDKTPVAAEKRGTPEKPGPEKAGHGNADTETADQETAKMRDSAAALSAVLASAPPAGNAGGRSRIWTVLMTVVAMIVVLGAGYSTFPSWRDRLPPVVQAHLENQFASSDALQAENRALSAQVAELSTALAAKENAFSAADSRIAPLETQIEELNARLATSEKTLSDLRAANSAGETAVAENAALRARVAALTTSLEAEKATRGTAEAAAQKAEALAEERVLAAGKLAATLENATGRIDSLEKTLEDARKSAVLAGKTGTIAMAARKLRDALEDTAPFEAELAALKEAAGEAPAIAAALGPLEPLASEGIATRSDLLARLPATVSAAIAADRQPTSDGWFERTAAKLTGFVTVRRIDGKGSGADAIVARAEIAARKGDLAGAADEMSSLTGPAAEASAAWLKAARDRLAADRARAALDKIVLTGVATVDPS